MKVKNTCFNVQQKQNPLANNNKKPKNDSFFDFKKTIVNIVEIAKYKNKNKKQLKKLFVKSQL